jgi:hypothetical protein
MKLLESLTSLQAFSGFMDISMLYVEKENL